MSKVIDTDICVIGGGSGGLSVAAGASQMGAKTVLIEKGLMGGDCLNYGCVPSKAILAAGHAAHAQAHSDAFGVTGVTPQVNWSKVRDHVKGVIAAIAPHDSVERFEGLGVTVIQEHGRFTGPRQVQAGDTTINAKYVVVATGSSAFVPPIEGLADTPYWTNETIFDNGDPVDHLIVVGGGPIGLEMAQAHRRLGAKVTVIEMLRAFGKDDPEAAELSGVNVHKTLMSVYMLSGLICAFAGWALIGRIGSVSPTSGQLANIESITAVVIGGISLFGGRGSIMGSLFGALIVGVFTLGLRLLGADAQWTFLLIGLLIIAAVAVDQWIRKVSG